MKCIQLSQPGGPDALEFVELPAPPLPAGHVRVKAVAIGVGRPDVMIRTGRVVETGAGVDTSLLGNGVLVSARELTTRGGCYADQVVVPASSLVVLPDDVDLLEAVNLPNYQLAWGLLHDATRGRLPNRIYVNGAGGGVGGALIQLCSQLGIEAVAGASSAGKREFAVASGALAAVDTTGTWDTASTAERRAALAEQVSQAFGEHGIDVVYDHLCGPHVAQHLAWLADFGLVVSYNALAGPTNEDVFAKLRRKRR